MVNKINLFLVGIFFFQFNPSVHASSPSCAASLETQVLSPVEILARTERSDVRELKKLALSEEGNTFASKYPANNEEKLFALIEGAAKELFEISEGRQVFLFARDGELIYDAVQTILLKRPAWQKLAPKFHLINVSRPIAKNHSREDLRTFLEHNGMNLAALLAGQEKILWIDTGFRGSIYINLFGAIIDKIDFLQSQEEINEQIVNVLRAVEPLLITSRSKPSFESVIEAIRANRWADASQVMNYLSSSLYFDEFLAKSRKKLGLPEEQMARYQWIVQNIEHNSHFNGRALKLSADAKSIVEYEIDAETNKENALAQQLRLIQNFSSTRVEFDFESLIEGLLKENSPQNQGRKPEQKDKKEEKEEKEENIIPVGKVLRVNLKAGDIIETEDGLRLFYVDHGGKGRRGVVYKVKNEKGQFLALKVAKNDDPDTLESFAEEGVKAHDAAKAGFRVPKIFEHKKTYIVKEWVQGLLAKDWLAQWAAGGFDSNDKAFGELKSVLKKSAKRGLYTGDLNRKNLIWNDEWIVIDSGTTTAEYSPSQVWARYVENISSRWSKELNDEVAKKFKRALEE